MDVCNTAVQDVLVFNKIAVPYDNFHLHENRYARVRMELAGATDEIARSACLNHGNR